MFSAADWNSETPLPKVTCTSHDCERDLHSFLRTRPQGRSYRSKQCRSCEAELIDWQRLDRHDLSDVSHTVASLERELIRHHYWHKTFDETAINHAKRKGLEELRPAAKHRLSQSVRGPQSDLFRDGSQTPPSGNVIYYAQHATATCCRKCIEAWHGIGREQPLTNDELGYMTELVMYYIRKRLPSLPLKGVYVPRRQSRKHN